ncbi:deaminase, partial [Burkholderia sp. Ac-20384]|nr:deaminase [Burkholderia sp. Ac-20384]
MRQILLLILLFFAGSWIARKLRQAQEQAQARTGRGAG